MTTTNGGASASIQWTADVTLSFLRHTAPWLPWHDVSEPDDRLREELPPEVRAAMAGRPLIVSGRDPEAFVDPDWFPARHIIDLTSDVRAQLAHALMTSAGSCTTFAGFEGEVLVFETVGATFPTSEHVMAWATSLHPDVDVHGAAGATRTLFTGPRPALEAMLASWRRPESHEESDRWYALPLDMVPRSVTSRVAPHAT